MFWISLVCFLLMVVAIVIMLNFSPKSFSDELMETIDGQDSLVYQVNKIQHGKRKNILVRTIISAKVMLEYTHQSTVFSIMVISSFTLGILGVVIACMGNNPYLIPPLVLGLCSIPFLTIKLYTYAYINKLQQELETTLGIVTTSYIRSCDILKAITESLEYMHSPVREVFEQLVSETKFVNPNLRQNIDNMKEKINDDIFKEWCDGLKKCVKNSELKYYLSPIVLKYNKLRHIKVQVKPEIDAWKIQLFGVIGLVYVNYPILAMMQNDSNDWFHVLTTTNPGKITIAYIAAVTVYSIIRFVCLIKPAKYKI